MMYDGDDHVFVCITTDEMLSLYPYLSISDLFVGFVDWDDVK